MPAPARGLAFSLHCGSGRGGRQFSYKELDFLVQRLAERLPDYPRNTIVGLSQDHKQELIITLIACWRRGFVPVPLDSRMPESSRRELYERLGFESLAIGRDWINLQQSIDGNVCQAGEAIVYPRDAWSDMVLTSGTSGEPKAVVHSFNNHQSSAAGFWQNLGESNPPPGRVRWLLCLPLFHIAGLAAVWRTLSVSGTLVCAEAASGPEMFASAVEHRVTHASMVPTQVIKLGDRAWEHRLDFLLLGGELVSPEVEKRARQFSCDVRVSYGCSEATSTFGMSSPGLGGFQPLPGRVLAIEGGELILGGQVISPGYWNGVNLEPILSQRFESGDMGEWLPGNRGLFTLVGRIGRRFISGGENVQPEEIERCLLALPGIERALVVPVKDPLFGERPLAILKAEGGWYPEKWRLLLSSRLPSYKLPDHWLSWPDESVLKPPIAKWQHWAQRQILTT